MRSVLALALLAATAFAHGGSYRGPRGGVPPGSPPSPGSSGGPTTPSGAGPGNLPTWDAWWYLNRDPYLRIRERITKREVITGPQEEREDFFDRRALREEVLLPVMLEALKDREKAVRGAAAIACGKFRARAAIPKLLEMTRRDRIREVRDAAVMGLMLMRDPDLRTRFQGFVLDADEERNVRGIAVLALGLLDDTRFLEELVARRGGRKIPGSRAARDEVRKCAALALGVSAGPAGVVPLVRTTFDERADRGVRGFASAALGRLACPLAVPEVIAILDTPEFLKEARYGAAVAAGGLVGAEQRALVDLLARKAKGDRHDGVRAMLLLSLGRIGGDRAATYLTGSVRNCEQRLRGFTYLALGLSGHPDAGPLLLETFGGLKSFDDRAPCAIALGLLDYKPAAPAIRKEVERGHPGFLPHGMIALGLLDDRGAIPLVRDALRENKSPAVRIEGATALALLRRTAAVPELVDLFRSSKSRHARGSIAAALGLVGTGRAVEPLLGIYRDRRRPGEERAVALAALGRIGDEARIPVLSQYAVHLNPFVGSEAVSQILGIL